MAYRYFPHTAFVSMPWKNGGGSTREILRVPEGSDDWQWRLSIADIAADGPFSAFPGCERSLTLLEGAGMRLQFADRHCDLRPPFAACRFAGEETPECVLFDGPTVDFNAIWRREAISITVERRAMHGSLWCLPEPGVSWFVYLLSGTLAVKDDPHGPQCAPGDGLWLEPKAGAPRLMLEAYGEALWLKIMHRARLS
jgi:environmental stress-induced protein Ves